LHANAAVSGALSQGHGAMITWFDNNQTRISANQRLIMARGRFQDSLFTPTSAPTKF